MPSGVRVSLHGLGWFTCVESCRGMGYAPLLDFVHTPSKAYEGVPEKRHRHTDRAYPEILAKNADIIAAQNKRHPLAVVFLDLLQYAAFAHQIRGKVNVVGDDFRGGFQKVFSLHRCNPFGGLRFGRWWKFARHTPAAFFIFVKNCTRQILDIYKLTLNVNIVQVVIIFLKL